MSDSRITFTLNRLVNELNTAADRILREQFQLTYSQFLFLVTLERSGTIPSSAFANQLGVSRAAISKRIPWFRDRDLIRVGTVDRDDRVVTLTITKTGSRLVAKTSQVLEQAFRDGFAALNSVNLDDVNDSLLIILNHLAHDNQNREESRHD